MRTAVYVPSQESTLSPSVFVYVSSEASLLSNQSGRHPSRGWRVSGPLRAYTNDPLTTHSRDPARLVQLTTRGLVKISPCRIRAVPVAEEVLVFVFLRC